MHSAAPAVELTTKEAIELLGFVSPSTLTRYAAEGKLTPARKLPGRTGAFLWYRHDIEALRAHLAATPDGAA
jgi:DNA-binding transcriptional MerR regulator